MTTRAASVARYHQRKRTDKVLDPKPRVCTNPRCTGGWARRLDGYYCTVCHTRTLELAEHYRMTAGKR